MRHVPALRHAVGLALIVTAIGRVFAQNLPEHARSREYNTALGVECAHCHVADDFSNASKPVFDFARRMERMVVGLNEGPLQGLGSIRCWSCHRGQRTPARLARADWESIATAHAADFVGGPRGIDLTMAVYSSSLGVDCSHCHVNGDWKNTSKAPHQTVARMQPVFDVIPQYFDKAVRMPVTQCFMCHHGHVRVE